MRRPTILFATVLSLLAGCGDDVIRVFPLTASPSLPHGHTKLIGNTLTIEMEGAEALVSDYRWVAWAKSDTGVEPIGEIRTDGPLALDVTTLATPAAEIEAIQISEEAKGSTLPASPSQRIWMHGEFPGPLHTLGIEDAALAAAKAEVHIDNKHIEVTGAGLPALPTGFDYAVWLMFEAEHGDEHGSGEAPMPESLGTLGGGTFLGNDLATRPFHASAAMVTIESQNGVAMMSSARVLHGAIVFTAGGSSTPAPAEPAGHTH